MKLSNSLKIFLLIAVVLAGMSTAEAKKRTRSKVRRASSGVVVTKGSEQTYCGNLVFRTYSAKKQDSKISVAFPVSGDEAVVTAIRQWICNSFGYPYSAAMTSPEALIKKTLAAVGPRKDIMELQQSITVDYSNDKVITMRDESYQYMGGAHGMPSCISSTFLTADGTELTSEMLPGIETMRPYIIQAMMKEYKMSRSELQDMCFGSLELPMGSPSVTANGLRIQYQSYEIAPYSAGMPSCTIPVAEIKNILSAEALKFLSK